MVGSLARYAAFFFFVFNLSHSARIKNHASCIRNCDICGIQFKKLPEWERHIAGKRHADQIARSASPESVWDEFVAGAPSWAADCNMTNIAAVWKDDELSSLEFKYRSTCLHPTPVIGNLKSYTRARVWRYMRDVMGLSHYPELAAIMAAADEDEFGHVRVKELFESLESYKVIANFIVAAQRTGLQNGYSPIERIVEVACGHGLVGILLAYRFRGLQVHLYDLERRPTFSAFLRAFESKGVRLYADDEKVLPNVHFYEEDFRNAKPLIVNSVVVCLHGCNEVNEMAIEMAIEEKASGWAVMPCCILKDQYLGEQCNVHLSEDSARYNMLCGALAQKYGAQRIAAIDTRITNRPMIIAGGVGASASTGDDGLGPLKHSGLSEEISDPEDIKAARAVSYAASVKRGKMPRLLLD